MSEAQEVTVDTETELNDDPTIIAQIMEDWSDQQFTEFFSALWPEQGSYCLSLATAGKVMAKALPPIRAAEMAAALSDRVVNVLAEKANEEQDRYGDSDLW